MGILNQILGLLFSLSILVFLHELGHFAFARLFKTRVEKFYLFFNPKISLLRAKKINGKWQVRFFAQNVPSNMREKVDVNGSVITNSKGKPVYEPIPLEEFSNDDWRKHPESTEWGIGWIPLGGYCAISGMIDETKSASDLPSEPQSWEYRSKKAWQRLLIISGGVLTNFVLALVIFSFSLFIWGKTTLPIKNALMGYEYADVLLDNGFKNGDKILKIDGKPIEDMSEFSKKALMQKATTVTLSRNNETIELALPTDLSDQIMASGAKMLSYPLCPFVVAGFSDDSPAKKAGMQLGDSIVSLNDSIMPTFSEFAKRIREHKKTPVKVGFYRNRQLLSLNIKTTEEGIIGIEPKSPLKIYEVKHTKYGFFESIPAGISLGVNTLIDYASSLKLLFTKEGAKQVGGFGAMGGLFAKEWDWQSFWSITALLSVILAFMNILPIPALDGGHVLFTLIEMITGRKPSDKFLEYAQTVGMFLLFALLILANGNDVIKLVKGFF